MPEPPSRRRTRARPRARFGAGGERRAPGNRTPGAAWRPRGARRRTTTAGSWAALLELVEHLSARLFPGGLLDRPAARAVRFAERGRDHARDDAPREGPTAAARE